MSTFAPEQDVDHQLRQVEQRKRREWAAYREGLRDLDGAEYEDAELRAWDRLQGRLSELERCRSELTPVGAAQRTDS